MGFNDLTEREKPKPMSGFRQNGDIPGTSVALFGAGIQFDMMGQRIEQFINDRLLP
jgi:hypothetical protein